MIAANGGAAAEDQLPRPASNKGGNGLASPPPRSPIAVVGRIRTTAVDD